MHNNIIFNNSFFDSIAISDLVKTRSWIWFVAKNGAAGHVFSDWCVCLLGCIISN